MRFSYTLLLLLAFILFYHSSYSQDYEKCGTNLLLESNARKDPNVRLILSENEARLKQTLIQNSIQLKTNRSSVITIPVVFHIVLSNQNLVTDAQVLAQVQMLNDAYSGINADTSKIPSYFKSLAGQSSIRFCLAQRTPFEGATSGIVRYNTSAASFTVESERIKHTATGGADAWNPDNYLNIWIGNLANNILGYSSFPGIGAAAEQGVVIHYSSLPGGTLVNYNKGKTLVHELGHYLFLYHIWGDDNGACTGSDQVDDTPNQGAATTGCPGAVTNDNCNRTSTGIMYQNYMDYSYDNCLLMFTAQQVARMETAFRTYRSSLLQSDGCLPIAEFGNNIQLKSIESPAQRICTGSLLPSFIIRNLGKEKLSSLVVHLRIDTGEETTMPWTGSLASLAVTTINTTALTASAGNHVLTIFTTNPNGKADEFNANDTMRFAFIYYPPSTPPIAESFEGNEFPPKGWDVVNEDASNTWQSASGVATSGNHAVVIRNIENLTTGEKDYLRMPDINLPIADSAFLSFKIAAAVPNALTTIKTGSDTLEVLMSTDCGVSYTSLYKKSGSALATRSSSTTGSFTPTASEWRKDSISLTPYLGKENLMLAFLNRNGNQNNIYLDEINLYTKVVNPYLKASGFLVSPNPVTTDLSIQFYPTPTDLQQISIYSLTGQTLVSIETSKSQRNIYHVDVSQLQPGIYIIRATFKDRSVTKKILKVH